MKITIFGTGYVGLVTGACFAEMGNQVNCVDIDESKIKKLNNGIIPIYEPGLTELVVENQKDNRLSFSSTIEDGLEFSQFYIIAVGTPQKENGSANLEYVESIAKSIGEYISEESMVVNKSTVPVGTAQLVDSIIKSELEKRGVLCNFHVVSNPEFLKEGDAVRDFMYPDRIIIGAESEYAISQLAQLYSSFSMKNDRLMFMGVKEAELTKYAANAMLATKISFINEIATLCDSMEIDVDEVRKGIGSDSRIGYSFIFPGCGYGGSCFPKDVKALVDTFESEGIVPHVLKSVEKRNQIQKTQIINQIKKKFGNNLIGLKFGIWGLSFKPDTDDMREAPSIEIINELISSGATIIAHDPVAINEAHDFFPEEWYHSSKLKFDDSELNAIDGADALILVTEWKMYRNPNFENLKKLLKQPVIFDGRNQYDPKFLSSIGFYYKGIGR